MVGGTESYNVDLSALIMEELASFAIGGPIQCIVSYRDQ